MLVLKNVSTILIATDSLIVLLMDADIVNVEASQDQKHVLWINNVLLSKVLLKMVKSISYKKYQDSIKVVKVQKVQKVQNTKTLKVKILILKEITKTLILKVKTLILKEKNTMVIKNTEMTGKLLVLKMMTNAGMISLKKCMLIMKIMNTITTKTMKKKKDLLNLSME